MLKPVLAVRIDENVIRMMKEMAKADNRSVPSYLENLIIQLYQQQNNK